MLDARILHARRPPDHVSARWPQAHQGVPHGRDKTETRAGDFVITHRNQPVPITPGAVVARAPAGPLRLDNSTNARPSAVPGQPFRMRTFFPLLAFDIHTRLRAPRRILSSRGVDGSTRIPRRGRKPPDHHVKVEAGLASISLFRRRTFSRTHDAHLRDIADHQRPERPFGRGGSGPLPGAMACIRCRKYSMSMARISCRILAKTRCIRAGPSLVLFSENKRLHSLQEATDFALAR